MPTVSMTSHLYRFFPALEHCDIQVPEGTVAEVLCEVNKIAPGFSDYIIDERGNLRQHVNICINNNFIVDRKTLSDFVARDSTLFIFQALTGG